MELISASNLELKVPPSSLQPLPLSLPLKVSPLSSPLLHLISPLPVSVDADSSIFSSCQSSLFTSSCLPCQGVLSPEAQLPLKKPTTDDEAMKSSRGQEETKRERRKRTQSLSCEEEDGRGKLRSWDADSLMFLHGLFLTPSLS